MGKAKKSKSDEGKKKLKCRRSRGGGPNRNPFQIFLKEVRERLRNRCPDLSQPEIVKRAGKCWRKLSDEQKDIYRQKAAGGRNDGFCPTCKRILPKKNKK